MNNNNGDNHRFDAREEKIREDAEEEEIFVGVNKKTISKEQLEKNHPDLDHNFQSPTINSGIMTVHHDYPDTFIGYPEDFRHYFIWILN